MFFHFKNAKIATVSFPEKRGNGKITYPSYPAKEARLLSPRAWLSYLSLMENALSDAQRSNSLVMFSIHMNSWFDLRGREKYAKICYIVLFMLVLFLKHRANPKLNMHTFLTFFVTLSSNVLTHKPKKN